MNLLAHLVFGILLYRNFGNIWLIPITIIFDLDHPIGFIYDHLTRNVPKLYKLKHFIYRPRSWFHSFTFLFLLIPPLSYLAPWYLVTIALASHLFMDAFDRIGVMILPPLINNTTSGPLPIAYTRNQPRNLKNERKFHLISLMFVIFLLILMVLQSILKV